MWRVGIEPTTSWTDERVGRKIKEKIKCGELGFNPQPIEGMRELDKNKGEHKYGEWGLNP